MPDRSKLKAGDTIRLLRVPDGDLAQRKRELQAGAEDAGSTADAIERIIFENPIVKITHVDQSGPWFERELQEPEGTVMYHALLIMDDDSWERVDEL